MRLTKQQESQATHELLLLLASDQQHGGEGLRTIEMRGTPRFHGTRTLSHKQIARLLRASGKAEATLVGSGMYSCNLWALTPPYAAVVRKVVRLTMRAEELHKQGCW